MFFAEHCPLFIDGCKHRSGDVNLLLIARGHDLVGSEACEVFTVVCTHSFRVHQLVYANALDSVSFPKDIGQRAK